MNREALIKFIENFCLPGENDSIHSETGRRFIRNNPKEYELLLELTSFVSKNSFNERFRVLKYGWTQYPKCVNPDCNESSLGIINPTCGKKNCKKYIRQINLKEKINKIHNNINIIKSANLTKKELIDLIEKECTPNEKLKIHNTKSLNFQVNFISEYKLLLELTNFVENKEKEPFTERYRVLKNNWTEYPICKAKNCNKRIKISTKEYCGCELGRIEQVKKNSLKKYGVDNYFKSEEGRKMISEKIKLAYQTKNVMEKRKKTNLKKYGTEHHMQNPEQLKKIIKTITEKYGGMGSASLHIKEKVEETSLEKYGFKSSLSNKKVIEKRKETNLEKYGEENYLKTKEAKEKIKKTNIENFGVDNIFKHKTYIKEKFKEKYGVENPSSLNWVQEKKEKTSFSSKQYKWKTGEISYVQGYEPFVLNYLEEKGYKFEEVLTSKLDMPEIIYIGEDNLEHRYFPDIYIPKENLIIEVKSEWTMKKEFYKNMLKFSAVKNLGFNFEIKVIERNSKRKLTLR